MRPQPWEFFSGGGISGQDLAFEVRAQEAPSVLDLSVIPSGAGVSAKCEFEGYEADGGYSMELYLNQVREDGTVIEIALKGILPPNGGAGMEITEGEPVETGVYKATLVMDRTDGGMLQVDNFRNSVLYDVIKTENGYVVTPYQEPIGEPGAGDESGTGNEHEPENEPKPEDEPVAGGQNGSDQDNCSHSTVSYRIVKTATPDQDSVLAGECSRCGEVLSYSFVPNSAYAAFLESAACAIRNAQGEETVVETERWLSFNQAVFDAMAQRPELTVRVRYRYKGKRYEVTVPAGAELSGLTDENGFCGFRYLEQVFMGKEIAE